MKPKITKHYLVDTCKGTFYYTTLEAAKKRFYNDKTAHTLAQYIPPFWYPIGEIIGAYKIGEPETVQRTGKP